ncbi:MAG TPA: uroporphyrinogen decarboxylase family protein [Candidatus Lokiarchaeia archaeon]|nr:uroporphyrinogen decarboxylase family protein [Candidatus Lokiarchaeia archaeon]
MNHKERFFATINREPVDRPASWLGMPASASLPGLYEYFGVNNVAGLKAVLDDDMYPVDVPYHSFCANHIACAFPFAKTEAPDYENRTLTTPGFFEGFTDPGRIDEFDWPDPSENIDPALCRAAVENVPEGYAVLGVLWSAHFQDACAAFGMKNALVTMLRYPEMFQAVIDRIVDFYLEANEIFYTATDGLVDVVLIGNDFGGQTGLLVSRRHVQEFVLPGTRRLISQAKDHGVKVMHHSCGAVEELIPDIIDAGADIIHPIQALAAGMEPRSLHAKYGNEVAFCGGVDTQDLLVRRSPEAVREKVHELREIFPTGLVISPSHEALLPDVSPANVLALFDAVKD